MSFEDDFRSTLQSQAGDLDLRGSGATEVMHLARRRQHRARRAGAVATVGVLGAGAVGVIAVRGRADDGVAVTSYSEDVGLPDVGPLELSWQTTPGGVTGENRFIEDAGALYALSTAPASQVSDDGFGPTRALYRLSEDGTWVPVGSGDVVPMIDVAVDGGVLYAFGTAPGASGVGYDSVVSSSSDGGASWVRSSVAPVVPPSTAVAWEASSNLAIERVPGATVAMLSSTFAPPEALIDEAAVRAGADPDGTYGFRLTDAGIDVISSDLDSWADDKQIGPVPTLAPTTSVPDASGGTVPVAPTTTMPAAPAPATSIGPAGARVFSDETDADVRARAEAAETVVTTITWSELGVSGRADLASNRVLVERDGAWVPVDSPALAGLSVDRLGVAGQDLVVEGWAGGDSTRRTLSSSDGVTWQPVALGEDSRLVGLGNAWVDVPWGDGAPVVRSSFDRGASWSSVDLGVVDGRLASSTLVSFDSSSLGLAAVAVDYGDDDADGATSYLVTTRDLQNWVVTPLSDITGSIGAAPSVHVGTDRIVITAAERFAGDESALPASITAVGTPVR